jgi:hypothetical protein
MMGYILMMRDSKESYYGGKNAEGFATIVSCIEDAKIFNNENDAETKKDFLTQKTTLSWIIIELNKHKKTDTTKSYDRAMRSI